MFPEMVKVVPQGKKGIAKIDHVTVTKDQAIMAMISTRQPLMPGPVARLYVKGQLMMSDGENERRTNYEVVLQSKGDVLIAGLGIGMILTPILAKKEVRSVTVIEKFQDVIDLVQPHFKSPKLNVICADIREWKPEKGAKFNTIYFDIWAEQSTDELEDMAKLHQRFKSFKAKEGWMDSWNRPRLLREKRENRRNPWY